MACSLCRHNRRVSSVIGVASRAYDDRVTDWEEAERRPHTLSRKFTSSVNSDPWRLDKYCSSSSALIKQNRLREK